MPHRDHDETRGEASAAPAADAAIDHGRRSRRHDGQRRRRQRTAIGVIAAVAVVAGAGSIIWAVATPHEVVAMVDVEPPATWAATTPTPSPTEIAAPQPNETSGATDPSAHPIAGDTASASSLTVLVNKITPLDPVAYEPDDLVNLASIGVPSMNDHSLREAAALGVQTMFAAAADAGHSLDMTSGYRSATLQAELYDGYVASLGQDGADATSARPGYSEHQTGLAADISAPDQGCVLEQCFADTGAGQWLAENAWQYGFVLRYPDGLTDVTGYEFEPWHFRYVGVDVSTAMHEQGVTTYEEFLGAPAAPEYAN